MFGNHDKNVMRLGTNIFPDTNSTVQTCNINLANDKKRIVDEFSVCLNRVYFI